MPQIWSQSPTLEPVRASWRSGESIEWTRVYDLPDFVYFDHSHPHRQGGRLRRAATVASTDEPHVAAALAAHGVVPRMPSQPGAEPAAALGGVQHGLAAARRPAEPRRRSGRRARRQAPATTVPSAIAERRAHTDTHDDGLHIPTRCASRARRSISPRIRARLAAQQGKPYWRSLEELAGTPEFEAYLQAEFPDQAPQVSTRSSAPHVPEADGRVARPRRRSAPAPASRPRRSSPTCRRRS